MVAGSQKCGCRIVAGGGGEAHGVGYTHHGYASCGYTSHACTYCARHIAHRIGGHPGVAVGGSHRDAVEQGAVRGACRARRVTLGGEGLIGKAIVSIAIVSIAMVTLGCEGLARGKDQG